MDLPFDLTDPPDRPPSAVSEPLFWRLAVCLFREHSPGLGGVGALVRCRTCAEVWPCRCRRLAERALIEACGAPTVADSDEPCGERRE